MKKTRFKDNEIVIIIRQSEQSIPLAGLYREHNTNPVKALYINGAQGATYLIACP